MNTMPLILSVPNGSGLAETELANYKNLKNESFLATAKGTTHDIFSGQKLVRSGNVVEKASADALATEMVEVCSCAKCDHTTYAHATVVDKLIDDSLTQIHCGACGTVTPLNVDTHAYVDAVLALHAEEADMGDEPGPGAPTMGDKAPADTYEDDKNGGNKIDNDGRDPEDHPDDMPMLHKHGASSETYVGKDADGEDEEVTNPEIIKAQLTLNPEGMEGANDANSDPGTDDASGMDEDDGDDDYDDSDIDPDAWGDDGDWGDDLDDDDGEDGACPTDDDGGAGDEMDSEGASTVVLKAKLVKPGKATKEAASSTTYKLDAPGEASIVSNPAVVVTEGENNDKNYTGDEHLPGNNDMPGVPRGTLEISSKLPVAADFRGDLVDLASRGNEGSRIVYVFYQNQPVGVLEEAKAIDSIKPSFGDLNKLHRGFVVAASMDSVKDYGFAPYITKVEIPDLTAKEVAKAQADFETKLNAAITDNTERFRQSLSIAALASVKGVWNHISNPVRDQLVTSLEANGFEGAAAVVDNAFAQGGPDFIKSLLTAALEYSAKSDVVREEIAHMVANATARSGPKSVALETASLLARGSLRVSAVEPAKETTREVATGNNVSSFRDSFKRLRG